MEEVKSATGQNLNKNMFFFNFDHETSPAAHPSIILAVVTPRRGVRGVSGCDWGLGTGGLAIFRVGGALRVAL